MNALKFKFQHLKSAVIVIGITALSANILSCNSTEMDGVPVANNTKDQKNSKPVKNLVSNFQEAVPVDSTSYVLYPLAISSLKEDSEIKSYYSDSRAQTYWNIAFHNIETGESKLLDSGRVLMISSYDRVDNYLLSHPRMLMLLYGRLQKRAPEF